MSRPPPLPVSHLKSGPKLPFRVIVLCAESSDCYDECTVLSRCSTWYSIRRKAQRKLHVQLHGVSVIVQQEGLFYDDSEGRRHFSITSILDDNIVDLDVDNGHEVIEPRTHHYVDLLTDDTEVRRAQNTPEGTAPVIFIIPKAAIYRMRHGELDKCVNLHKIFRNVMNVYSYKCIVITSITDI